MRLYVLALFVLLLPAGGASAQQDYATDQARWNSVSELIRIAERREISVIASDRLDAGELDPADSLLILSPQRELPTGALTAFLRAGGRACLADDFGTGEPLLSLFQITRGEASANLATQVRGNPALLVARPNGSHRLTRGVPAVVTNHPTVVFHRELAPIFQVVPGEAVVLAGAVGAGRLVVVSDPSAMIDNMLELRGNRRFAENLIDYLEDGRGGRLFVVGPEARIVGRFGEPGADRPLHDLRASLEALAGLDLPPMALRVASLALAAIAVLLAIGTLPRRSPYRSAYMFARDAAQGGFVGRVGFFTQRGTNLLQPLMVYKFELEAEIIRRLALDGRTLLRDVLKVMRDRGMAANDVTEMRELLLTLDQLHDAQDRPATPPSVGRRRFRELVATGDRLLTKLEEA